MITFTAVNTIRTEAHDESGNIVGVIVYLQDTGQYLVEIHGRYAATYLHYGTAVSTIRANA